MAAQRSGSVSDAMRDHILLPAQEMAKLGKAAQPVLTHAEGIYV